MLILLHQLLYDRNKYLNFYQHYQQVIREVKT